MSAVPSFLVNPWSTNMYAPKWASITPQMPGWCDVEFDFDPITITVGPGVQSLKNQLLVDGEADYLAREIIALPIVGTTGTLNPQDLKIRLTDGDGQFITSDWCTLNDLNGPIGPAALPLRKGSQPYFDIWNQGAATAVLVVGFKGWKRVKCDAKQVDLPEFVPQSRRFCQPWAPQIRFEEYEYFFEFVNGVLATAPPWAMNLQPQTPNQVFQQIPLRTDEDASFLWRGTSGMIMSASSEQIVGNWFLRFFDSGIVPLALQVPRPNLVPSLAGPAAELVLSNGGGRMSPQFSEVYIPRGGLALVDIGLLTSNAISVQFSLRGVKVYGEEACKSS
jgi:hypothetical protein